MHSLEYDHFRIFLVVFREKSKGQVRSSEGDSFTHGGFSDIKGYVEQLKGLSEFIGTR